MIPILYDSTETTFASNGIGRLAEATSCVVTEERNGKYELTLTYPITGKYYSEITEGRIIATTHDDDGDIQPFVIYRRQAPINGLTVFNCHHISYLLNTIIAEPFPGPSQSVSSMGAAFDLFNAAGTTLNTNPFTFWTDNTTAGTCKSILPASIRSLLGGTQGSLLDAFGGEYEWDKFTVKNHAQRGSNTGITIRYGKNLTDIEAIVENEDAFASVVPYWESVDGDQVVIGTKITSGHEGDFPGAATVPLDLSESFEEAPTVAQLNAKATAYLTNNSPWEIDNNLTISFVSLSDTEEYKNMASLQAVNLCDTVHVVHPGLGVSVSAKVIRTRYDVLTERYDEIELGKPRTSLKQAIAPVTKTELENTVQQSSNFLLDSMEEMVGALFGVDGGHIKFVTAPDGHISEIYAMDTDDEATATNVLRINYQGIYCSTNGINGTYNLAISTIRRQPDGDGGRDRWLGHW